MSLAEEILDVLSHQDWKTVREIIGELRVLRGIPATSIFRGPSYGSLYVNLDRLEEDGLVECRERTSITADELEARGGSYPREYRLTSRGTKEKVKKESRQSSSQGFLRPQLA